MLLLSHVEISSIVVSANLLGILHLQPEQYRARGESVFMRSLVAGSVAGISFFKGSDREMLSEGGELSFECHNLAKHLSYFYFLFLFLFLLVSLFWTYYYKDGAWEDIM